MLAAQRYYFIAFVVFFVLLSLTFFHFTDVGTSVRHRAEHSLQRPCSRIPYRNSNPTLRDTITSLFGAIKHDPTNPRYRAPNGKWFETKETIWKEPLGKRVLIVDIDTRVPNGENQILNPTLLDYEHLEPSGGGLVSNAIINHYMYAMIHGYDYKYYQAQHIKDHYDTWIMPHVFRELVPNYDFVIAMDADAVVSHLEVPLEWMFNRWGIQKHTSMALPWDTEQFRNNISISRDSHDLRVLNTGFVVAQNSPQTLELLEAWRDCTTEKRYPGCSKWAKEWSHEQRAFSEYIRYDFNNTPETVVSIPCDDAVGYPDFAEINAVEGEGLSDCNGNFVRHYTLGKEMVKQAGAYSLMQSMSDVLQKSLLKKSDDLWIKERQWRKNEAAHPPQRTHIEEEAPKETDAGVPENIDQERVEQTQNEIKKFAEEKIYHTDEGKEEEESAPVVLDGMMSPDSLER